MTQAELRELARVGAEARLAELQREIDAITRAFPDLRSGRHKVRAAPANGRRKRRRRRPMSAAQRKALSLAQKKRWAEWRKKKGQASA